MHDVNYVNYDESSGIPVGQPQQFLPSDTCTCEQLVCFRLCRCVPKIFSGLSKFFFRYPLPVLTTKVEWLSLEQIN